MIPVTKLHLHSIAFSVLLVALNCAAEIVQPSVPPNISAVAEPQQSKRLLWEIKTVGGPDRIVEMFSASGKLLLMRRGVLYAYDARSGQLLWKFPEQGRAWRFTENTSSFQYPFIQGQYGNEIITCLPEKEGIGCAGIDLDTGQIVHRLKLNGEFAEAHSVFKPLITGNRMAFWRSNQDRQTSVLVADLDQWQEYAHFDLPRLYFGNDMYALGDRVYGELRDRSGTIKLFTVDLKTAEFFSVPLRHSYSSSEILPDGTRITTEELIGPKCNFVGLTDVIHAENGIGFTCVDEFGLGAVDIASGKVLWKFNMGHTPEFRRGAIVASCKDLTALYDSNYLHVLDSKTGALKLSIRAFDFPKTGRGELMHSLLLQTDGQRLFVAEPGGLRVYATHALDPERADASDPADPQSLILAARQALLKGDYESALKALSGISVSNCTRPSSRMAAAGLLSQLSRSKAPTLFPREWTKLMLDDGCIAGELFLPEFKRLALSDPRAAAALNRLGVKDDLKPSRRNLNQQGGVSADVVREQLESQAAGEGKKTTIDVIWPSKPALPPKPPKDDF